jgi:hypothetical protein
VVDESSNGTSRRIDDHFVVEAHEVVALILLVHLLHASLTFGLSNDLTSVLNYDLMGLKGSHCTNTVTTAFGLHDLDSVIVSVSFSAPLQFCERAIPAFLWGESAVCAVALVCHDAIVAGFSAPVLRITVTLRRILLVTLPQGGCVTNKAV